MSNFDEHKKMVFELLENPKYDWNTLGVEAPLSGDIKINIILRPKSYVCQMEPETEAERKVKREYNALFNKHGLFWK